MIRYELTTSAGKVIVSLRAERPDTHARIEYEGPEPAIKQIHRDVERSSGVYGHALADATSPLDLRAAMSQAPLAMYRPRLLEGQEILDHPHEKTKPGRMC